MDAIELAAVLVTLALLASIISIEFGVTVALVELTLGVMAGNVFTWTARTGSRSSHLRLDRPHLSGRDGS